MLNVFIYKPIWMKLSILSLFLYNPLSYETEALKTACLKTTWYEQVLQLSVFLFLLLLQSTLFTSLFQFLFVVDSFMFTLSSLHSCAFLSFISRSSRSWEGEAWGSKEVTRVTTSCRWWRVQSRVGSWGPSGEGLQCPSLNLDFLGSKKETISDEEAHSDGMY